MSDLLERLSGPPKNGEYHTIGIDGRGGAGKSTLANWLAEHMLEGFVVSGADNYYEPVKDDLVPGLFNTERFMVEVGASIIAGRRQIEYQPYSWPNRPAALPRTVEVSGGLIHEGVKTLALPIDWDVTIWVDSPRELCLERYLDRPFNERKSNFSHKQLEVAGKEYARHADQHINAVDPLHTADIVIDGTVSFEQQFAATHLAAA